MSPASTKPYLVRAIFEWCCDQGFTPHLGVRVNARTRVPAGYVKDGEIVLNVSPAATRNLKMDNDWIRFSARFNGVSQELSIPMDAVAGIFAKENGQGLFFETPSETAPEASTDPRQPDPASPGNRPRLQVIK